MVLKACYYLGAGDKCLPSLKYSLTKAPTWAPFPLTLGFCQPSNVSSYPHAAPSWSGALRKWALSALERGLRGTGAGEGALAWRERRVTAVYKKCLHLRDSLA